MSSEIETTVSTLVHALARNNSIRAVGMSGGERSFPEPGAGDIDLFVYCTEIPAEAERKDMLTSLPEGVEQVEIGKLESEHWGQGDCFFMAGIETWLLYFTVAEVRAELEAILSGNYLGRLDS